MNPRTRALITIGLVITILTLFFLFIFVRQQKLALSNTILNEQESQKKIMRVLLDQIEQRYTSRLKSLVTNRQQVMHSFAAKNRNKLLQQSSGLLTLLKQENPYITAFFFANPDNTIFLRVHKPELYDDDITYISPLIAEANRTRKVLSGFEIVKHGLQFRIVHPIFLQGKYIGLAGFGINIDFFLNQLYPPLHAKLHKGFQQAMDIGFVFPKAELAKTVFLDRPSRIFDNYTLFFNRDSYFVKLPDHFNLKKEIQQIQLDNVSHAVLHTASFKDFKDNIIAWSIAVIDINRLVVDAKHTIMMTIILSLGLLLLTFVILYFNFSLLFKKITLLNQSLEQNNKKLEQRVNLRTADLQKSESRYRFISENISDIIWTMDMELNYTYISPSVYQQRGYTVKEAMTQSLDEVLLPESLKKIMDLFAENAGFIEKGDPRGWEPVVFEIEQFCKDGTTIWTSNNARILKVRAMACLM